MLKPLEKRYAPGLFSSGITFHADSGEIVSRLETVIPAAPRWPHSVAAETSRDVQQPTTSSLTRERKKERRGAMISRRLGVVTCRRTPVCRVRLSVRLPSFRERRCSHLHRKTAHGTT
ncbi:hypothetical protein PUN28_017745 [Cardiocondyla obscurior]|uniref:Uncharacterized protein n=1 Tax=Cardiocondyla obscurior TaxID=286306 RepID=A0AAW2EPT1_9HYME